ncbi:MAG: sn-glycerol-3-phosphate ABC transporter ATP-binding protein UgpC [Burkholderiaceae bacterium]|nr:sn-glycerol-3-phosphate ABC transporter ATP-binding protein UgpC [Burkholderiaceae bacterium]
MAVADLRRLSRCLDSAVTVRGCQSSSVRTKGETVSSVSLRGVSKVYAPGVRVIQGVDLDIAAGEFMVFVGPSGCGKSTLLRMVAGLEDISGGELLMDGRRMNDLAPAERGVAMVFQSYALYPHMSVFDNMAFGLRQARMPRAEIDTLVRRTAATLQLDAMLDRLPKALSGGQRQRVAIGRCIVRQPRVFLFDEPLSNLDAALRVQMRIELAKLHRRLGCTVIYVTHDQVEAMTLGERIAVFNAGRIEQVGAPLDLYAEPANLFVAGFLGAPRMNLLPAMAQRAAGGGQLALRLPTGAGLTLPVPPACKAAAGDAFTLGLRPEHLYLVSHGSGLAGQVELVEHLGDSRIAYVRCQGLETPLAVRLRELDGHLPPGTPVRLLPDGSRCNLFDAQGRAVALLRGDAHASHGLTPQHHYFQA